MARKKIGPLFVQSEVYASGVFVLPKEGDRRFTWNHLESKTEIYRNGYWGPEHIDPNEPVIINYRLGRPDPLRVSITRIIVTAK